MYFTSRLYKDAEEVKQDDWTARPDHTTKEDVEWLIMVPTVHPALLSLHSEIQADTSHSATPYKQGCQTKQEGGGKVEPT